MSSPAPCNGVRDRKRACLACRIRKVRCIAGPGKRCERCTTLGFKDCVYEPIKKRGMGKTLRMGEACTHCRARKRRCDAKRPCTRCVEANRALECQYEILGTPLGPSDCLQLIPNEPGPSGLSDALVQGRRAVEEAGQEFPPKTSVAAVTQLRLEPVPPARALVHPLGRNNSPPGSRPRTLDQVRTNRPPRIVLPPFSVLSALISPRIPPEPHVTLSFLGAEWFQLSDVALGELDMKFRLGAMRRLNKLGIRFTSEKQRALLRGDTSGTVINPFFVYAAQSIGMHFCEDMENSPAMIRLQATYLRVSFKWIVDVFEGHDWELRAQVALWITAGAILLLLNDLIFLYMRRGCEVIDTAGLQFIPTYGRPPPFSEDLHEKLSVLSQIVYFENYLFLTCGGPEPTMTARVEKEFRHQLQEVYPVLFNICPLIMRTQTILLVRDTIFTLEHRPTDVFQLGIWRQSCDQMVTLLDDYSQTLLFNLRKFQELGDTSGAGMIRSSCVNCLAHLAVLCEVLAQIEPDPQTQMDILCDSTLERLGELTQDTREEEYTRLDLLLGVSWKKALGVFDARLAIVSPESGTKLRHWKKTVAEAYSDFAAKLPNPDPPMLFKRARLEHGSIKTPPYPHLVPPGT